MENKMAEAGVPWKEYVDVRIDALQAKVDEANTTARAAIDRALNATEKRFEATNEWRQSLNDFSTRLVTREQVESMIKAVETRVDGANKSLTDLEKRNANMEGRIWGVGLVLGFVFSLLQLALHFLSRGT